MSMYLVKHVGRDGSGSNAHPFGRTCIISRRGKLSYSLSSTLAVTVFRRVSCVLGTVPSINVPFPLIGSSSKRRRKSAILLVTLLLPHFLDKKIERKDVPDPEFVLPRNSSLIDPEHSLLDAVPPFLSRSFGCTRRHCAPEYGGIACLVFPRLLLTSRSDFGGFTMSCKR